MSPPVPRPTSYRLALPLVAVGLCAALLSGCGGSSGAGSSTSTSPSPAPSSPGPVVTAAGPVPGVEGRFGEVPTITIPSGDPAPALVTKTLVKGDGAVVKSGDLLVVNYVGETWDDGKVFDSSFNRGAPAAFQIGVGKVIPGWDHALVGQTVGSRVVMALPPDLGYGAAGQETANISGTDTLVFVVDILAAYPAGVGAATDSTPTNPDLTGLPGVTGLPGQKPTVTVPAGTTPPTETTSVVLATGKGEPVTAGSYVIIHYEAVTWNNNSFGSTWTDGAPHGTTVGLAATPSPFDKLVGLPVGSRVLLLVPANPSGDPAVDSVAVVIDIIDSIPPTK
jgi:peptidylprolyl isomerase